MMKGDFSRLDNHDADDVAVLLQQGRPILDSQLNGANLTVLRRLEEAITMLTARPLVTFRGLGFDDKGNTESKAQKLDITDNKDGILFPADHIFVHGKRATILGSDIKVSQGKETTAKINASDGKHTLFGEQLTASRTYILFLQLLEETVFHGQDKRVPAEDNADDGQAPLRFIDPAVTSSDSLRLRRFARFGLAPDEKWTQSKTFLERLRNRAQRRLTLTLDDHAAANELLHFEFQRYDHGAQKLTLKWSRDNAAAMFSVSDVKAKDTTIVVPELAASMQTVRQGQYVELLEEYPHTPRDSATQTDQKTWYEISSVDLSANKLDLAKAIEDPGFPIRLVRIWDGMFELVKHDRQNADPILRGEASGITAELPLGKSEDTYRAGDYWTGTLRVGDTSIQAEPRSTILAIEQVCKLTIDDSFKISKLPDVGHDIASHPLQTETFVSSNAALEDVSSHRSPETVHLLHATSCRNLIGQVKCAPLKQWLASLTYEELCDGSDAALRERIVRDCGGKLSPQDDLKGDLAVVFQERRKLLHNDTGLLLA